MEKTKIFTQGTSDEFDALELRVNRWLKKNDGIEITSRHVVGMAGVNVLGQGFINCTIVIFYKEKKV